MNLISSLPSFGFGSEKLSDVDILPETIHNQLYFMETAVNNLAAAAEFTYPEVTAEAAPPVQQITFKPEINNSPTIPAEVTYNTQVKNVANGALNGAVHQEQIDAARVNDVRNRFSDVLGGQ